MLDRYSKDILLCSLKDIKPEAGSVCRSEWTVQWKLNFIPTVTWWLEIEQSPSFFHDRRTDTQFAVRSSADSLPSCSTQFLSCSLINFVVVVAAVVLILWRTCCLRVQHLSYRSIYLSDERKKPLGKSMCRWEDNIERDVKGTVW